MTTEAAVDDRDGPAAEVPAAPERGPSPDAPARRRAPATPRPAAAADPRLPSVVTASRLPRELAEAHKPAVVAPSRHDATRRRLLALLALLLIPLSVLALVSSGGPAVAMSSADARFVSGQLLSADQRVRLQLQRLRDEGTARALARTREAIFTTRSLAVETRSRSGPEVGRLRRALRLEGAWLDAVGSTLLNPRSPLRERLLVLDEQAREALARLPTAPAHRKGGARSLVSYARTREQATLAGSSQR